MKLSKFALLLFVALSVLTIPAWWYIGADREDNDPDFPAGMKIDKESYLLARDQNVALLRGFDTALPESRSIAIRDMETKERQMAARGESVQAAAWKPLGPAPIPNGQTTGRTDPVSGRVISIAVNPTNANTVYLGTAQGGLYRSLDGGTTWVPIMDSALSLAIGSIAIAPSDPTTIFVGTGEAGFCGDCFFGVGVYRITNAESANPTVSGPLRLDAVNSDVFAGRAIGKIVVHPTDPNIIYVGSNSGTAGIAGSTTGGSFASRGLFRSSNAMAASPVFEKLTVSAPGVDRNILSAVLEPGDPTHMFVTLVDATGTGDGGIYFTTNANAAAPTFTRVFTTGAGAELGRAELAIQKTGNTVTVYCAHGTSSGRLSSAIYDTTAPGTPVFNTLAGGVNFCSGQCFYDIAVAVDPTNASKVYLAGSPTMPFGFSTNGGASFTSSTTGLHVDSHVITVAPSNTDTLYYGSDGGVWKSTNAGAAWVSMNNATLSATQFESIAVHPNDRHYTLGGTQDNGTEYLFPDGTTWTRAVAGDGGMVVIDSNSTSPTNLTTYHTFFNQSNNQIGFARATTAQANGNPIYGNVLGCSGTTSNNGIICSDPVLFYAPLVLGPNATGSTGNTVYFGTNKLYRSINQGTTMAAVSQVATSGTVSAIGIAPQNDDIRMIGTTTGRVMYSNTSAATTMTDITGTVPARLVGRIAIDPTDQNTAYVALGGFGIPNQHVMKTTNLNAPTPVWTTAGTGIPDAPTNGLVVDPANPQQLFAGTDIGVFRSTDGGTSWVPFSVGLPRVAVFQIVLQASNRILKIATHGRGIFEYDLNTTAKSPYDYDGDGKSDVSVFRPATGVWYLNRSTAGIFGITWGLATDKITPADYDGDGKTDVAVFRPSEGRWYIFNSATSTFTSSLWGAATDIPTPGDFDGDGKADVAIFRPSDGNWWLNRSTAGSTTIPYGQNGDVPVVGDYDADGKADIAIFRPSNGLWSLHRSTAGELGFVFGISTDKVAQADYDGDGKTDIAVWRAATGTWFIANSATATFTTTNFGAPTDIPTPGDYDGDGKADIAIFRPADGNWWENRSTGGTTVIPFGQNGDLPTENAFGN